MSTVQVPTGMLESHSRLLACGALMVETGVHDKLPRPAARSPVDISLDWWKIKDQPGSDGAGRVCILTFTWKSALERRKTRLHRHSKPETTQNLPKHPNHQLAIGYPLPDSAIVSIVSIVPFPA